MAAVLLGAGGAAAGVLAGTPEGSASPPSPSRAALRSVAAVPVLPPAPLGISLASASTGVDGSAPVVFYTTGTVALAASQPTVAPAEPGTWSAGPDSLTWTPAGAVPPSSALSFTFPAGLTASGQQVLASPVSFEVHTAAGSTLRLQQLLAGLGYLPLHFAPAVPLTTGAEAEQAVYHPPAGTFSWGWASVPPALASQWAPGADNTMTRGAVMAFEHAQGLAVDGIAGAQVWSKLLAATAPGVAPAPNPDGYTFALASKARPETLTVWHDGQVISRSPTNSGIAAAPTPDGTFAVYERLATQVMRGTNPDGSRYADPVAWVAYFHGGDAIHYIARSSYGFPQSVGCLEVPYAVGAAIWPHLTIGTLVTVTG